MRKNWNTKNIQKSITPILFTAVVIGSLFAVVTPICVADVSTISFVQPLSGVDGDTSEWSTTDSMVNFGTDNWSLLNGTATVTGYRNGGSGILTHRGTRGLGVSGAEDDEVDSINKIERLEIMFDTPHCLSYLEVRSLFKNEGPSSEPEEGDVDLYLGASHVGNYHLVGVEGSGTNGVWNISVPDILVDRIKFYVNNTQDYANYSEFAVAKLDVEPCEPAIEVNKTVWDPYLGMWVEKIEDANISQTYRFRCEVHNNGSCCNLTDIKVADTLSDSLEYVDNATVDGVPQEPGWQSDNQFGWNFTGPLASSQKLVIEFDVKVIDCGNDSNVQNATAYCTETDKWVSDEDDAWVNVPDGAVCGYGNWEDDPANSCKERREILKCSGGACTGSSEYVYQDKPRIPGIDVEKRVWNGTAWVKKISANISDIVIFNSTIHNNGTCCNLTNITVMDTLSDSLEYVGVEPPTPAPVVIHNPDGTTTLKWDILGPLAPCQTLIFLIYANVTKHGDDWNKQSATAEACEGTTVYDEDYAYVNVSQNPAIAVEPELTVVQPQDQFDVNITVDPRGESVYGVEYYLKYNTSAVRAETQAKGPFLGDAGETLVLIDEIDHTNGIVSYAETRKVSGGVTQKDTVARIHFIAIGARGATSPLDIYDVIIVDENKIEVPSVLIIDGDVTINENRPPVANGTPKHQINNVAKKYPCNTTLCSCSTDPDYPGKGSNVTYIHWAFGDGQYGTSEGLPVENCTCKEHRYESWQWSPFGDPNGDYVPFNAVLTVTDDGCPEETNTTDFDVTVYIAGDANGDGRVNILDAVYVGKHWSEHCSTTNPCDNCYSYLWNEEQQDKADLNNDCVINILDAVIIGANWGYTAW
jgi:uncharacterized repeat protein (TIGR01451 family)